MKNLKAFLVFFKNRNKNTLQINNRLILDLLGIYILKKQTDILIMVGRSTDAKSIAIHYQGFGKFNLRKNSIAGLDYLTIRASIDYHMGQYDSCRDFAERIINIKLKGLKKPEYLLGSAYNHLSLAKFGKGNISGAINASQKAMKLIPGYEQAEIVHNLATFQFYTGDYKAALDNYKKAYKIFKETGDLAGIVNSLSGMASVLVKIGNPEKAASKFIQTLKKQLKMKHLHNAAQTMTNLGVTYDILGKFDLSEKYYFKSIEFRKRFHDLHGLAYCYHNLGSLLRKQNNFSRALIYLEKAIKIRSKLGEKLSLAYSYNAYGNTLLELNFPDKAKSLMERVLEISIKLDNKIMYCYGLNSICNYYYEMRNYVKLKNTLNKFKTVVQENKLTQFNNDLKIQRKKLNELKSANT